MVPSGRHPETTSAPGEIHAGRAQDQGPAPGGAPALHREAGARTAALAEEHERTGRALRERVKELDCLYGISRLAQNRDLSLEQVIRRVGELVCASWQYPEIACSRIRAGDLDIATAN